MEKAPAEIEEALETNNPGEEEGLLFVLTGQISIGQERVTLRLPLNKRAAIALITAQVEHALKTGYGPSGTTWTWAQAEMEIYEAHSKIDAIKRIRTLTGQGLKEAKDLVEEHMIRVNPLWLREMNLLRKDSI